MQSIFVSRSKHEAQDLPVKRIISIVSSFLAHDTVQTRLDKFNENWTNVIAFKGESGKVLIQQHDWIKSC
jgi:hypothetical protein